MRRARERLAEESVALVGEGLGKNAGILFDHVVGEPVLPGVQRSGGHQSGLAGEGGGLPHDEAGLLAESSATEVHRPIKAGGLGGEVSLRPGVVRLVDVVVLRQAEVLFRDGMLQRDDALGASVGVGESRQLEHGGDVRLILSANVAHVRAVRKVIVAVGQLHSALHQVGGVVLGIVEAGSHPQSEQVRSVEVGVVQRVGIGAQGRAQRGGQVLLVLNAGNGFQVRRERRDALVSMAASSMYEL